MRCVPSDDDDDRRYEPDRRAVTWITFRQQNHARGEERDREVGQRDGADDSGDAERDDRPRRAGTIGLEGGDDQDAHGEERETVAARLAREVEQ